MFILILHGSYHRLQFISGNPSFRFRRHAKWSSEVCMDPIIDCSSSLETHHSAADVLQNAHLKSTWNLKGCFIVFGSPQCGFRCGPGATFGVPDVCLGLQDAARCRQDGLKLDSTCHLELSETFIDAVQSFKISPSNARMFQRSHQDAIRMISNPTPTLPYFKSWGMGVPQGVGFRVCTN